MCLLAVDASEWHVFAVTLVALPALVCLLLVGSSAKSACRIVALASLLVMVVPPACLALSEGALIRVSAGSDVLTEGHQSTVPTEQSVCILLRTQSDHH